MLIFSCGSDIQEESLQQGLFSIIGWRYAYSFYYRGGNHYFTTPYLIVRTRKLLINKKIGSAKILEVRVKHSSTPPYELEYFETGHTTNSINEFKIYEPNVLYHSRRLINKIKLKLSGGAGYITIYTD